MPNKRLASIEKLENRNLMTGIFSPPLEDAIAIGDFNGDGYDDLAAVTKYPDFDPTIGTYPDLEPIPMYYFEPELRIYYGAENGLSDENFEVIDISELQGGVVVDIRISQGYGYGGWLLPDGSEPNSRFNVDAVFSTGQTWKEWDFTVNGLWDPDLAADGNGVPRFIVHDPEDIEHWQGDVLHKIDGADFNGDGTEDLVIKSNVHGITIEYSIAAAKSAVTPTLSGDVDGDGTIAFTDFLVLANNFNMAGTRAEGDLDGDGFVNFLDFQILANNFGSTMPT